MATSTDSGVRVCSPANVTCNCTRSNKFIEPANQRCCVARADAALLPVGFGQRRDEPATDRCRRISIRPRSRAAKRRRRRCDPDRRRRRTTDRPGGPVPDVPAATSLILSLKGATTDFGSKSPRPDASSSASSASAGSGRRRPSHRPASAAAAVPWRPIRAQRPSVVSSRKSAFSAATLRRPRRPEPRQAQTHAQNSECQPAVLGGRTR